MLLHLVSELRYGEGNRIMALWRRIRKPPNDPMIALLLLVKDDCRLFAPTHTHTHSFSLSLFPKVQRKASGRRSIGSSNAKQLLRVLPSSEGCNEWLIHWFRSQQNVRYAINSGYCLINFVLTKLERHSTLS